MIDVHKDFLNDQAALKAVPIDPENRKTKSDLFGNGRSVKMALKNLIGKIKDLPYDQIFTDKE